MKNKLLIVSTVARQFYLFEENNIAVLKELGIEIHGAADMNDTNPRLGNINIHKHHIKIRRSPFNPLNIVALLQLIYIIKRHRINIIHCHSPVGGVLGRIAGLFTNVDKIIYTVHGFHFYKGSPKLNWFIYYPIEYILSYVTDYALVINSEDFLTAKKLKYGYVCLINGVGVDMSHYSETTGAERLQLRVKHHVKDDCIVILSVGELSIRKNYSLAIDILSELKDENVQYIICGVGGLESKLRSQVSECDLDEMVRFMGYRNDINEICKISDIFFNTTKQEGLPVSVIEAMACGLPVVCTKVRGNTDLIVDNYNGLLFEHKEEGVAKLRYLIRNTEQRQLMKFNNLRKVEEYSSEEIKKDMHELYSSILKVI